ncbi:FecR family protein, partial [Prevotella sp.]|uniref:FecR family protein n=1 Tax=Prevotella sp. TaxID=59823 RepID=UPI002F945D2F
MKYQRYRLLIEKLFNRQLTPQQSVELDEWLARPDESEGFDDMCHALWVNTPTAANDAMEASMLTNILSSIDQPTAESRPRRPNYYKIAAIGLLVVTFGLATYAYRAHQTMADRVAEVVENTVEKGQKARLTLPDGTKVWLNSYSHLTYNGAYNLKDRIVKLSGEAYFEVAKNKEKPFIVECDGVSVEALGTTFDVKAYPSDPTITTSLIEGRVKVSDKKSGITLEPNQQLVYDKKSNTFAVAQTDNVNEADFWRKDILYFNATPLSDIAKTIERMYDVKVVMASNDLSRVTFSGTIRNNSLENIFHVISLTYPLSYELHGDTILLKHR